jgi:hypothetical protein
VVDLAAYHAAFLAAAAVALVGSVVALTINDADASATMVRRRAGREVQRTRTRSPAPEPAS